MPSTIRTPAVAGTFYPAIAHKLQNMVQNFLTEAKNGPAAKAIIAPHAGYVYSGPIAASVYTRLLSVRDTITKVVLLGPSHQVPMFGLAASSMQQFATPLGNVPLDRQAIDAILPLPQVTTLDQAHAYEHSLEVQLPFLQEVLTEFSLIPLVVGEATPQQIGAVLEKLWGDAKTLIVISSDLSHYLNYSSAQKMDKLTSATIENMNSENIQSDWACGHNPINGLLHVARKKGMQAQTIDLRNSGDTAGSKDRVVGYGAYVFN